jgi:predicted dehydrogenase
MAAAMTETTAVLAKAVEGRKVRYAVVGVGWISQAEFMPGVEHTENSEMVALVSGHEEKASKVARMYGIGTVCGYEEFDALLASGEVDAVYLATPNFDHVEYAVKTLEAGVHLLLEKPMAVSVDECERILAAAAKSGAKLMIAYRLHFEPGTLKAIERIRNGEIGTVRLFNSTFSQPVSGQNHRAKNGFWAGPVPDMGPYPLNMVRNVFGAEPIEVFATGVCTDPERFRDKDGKPFEDTVAVTLKFEDERVASFVLSYNGGDVDEYRVVGAKGDLFSKPAYQVGVAVAHELTVDKKSTSESFKKTDHFGGELEYFSECVLNNENPEPDGEEGMLDVRVLVAIEQSLLTGTVQKLPPYKRDRRPDVAQVQKLGTVPEAKLVDSHKPSEGQ